MKQLLSWNEECVSGPYCFSLPQISLGSFTVAPRHKSSFSHGWAFGLPTGLIVRGLERNCIPKGAQLCLLQPECI